MSDRNVSALALDFFRRDVIRRALGDGRQDFLFGTSGFRARPKSTSFGSWS
jgi:hypothetical protein